MVHKKHTKALRCAQRSRLVFYTLIGLVNLFCGYALVRYETSSYTDSRRPLSPSRPLVHSGLRETYIYAILDMLQQEMLSRYVGVVLDPHPQILALYTYISTTYTFRFG